MRTPPPPPRALGPTEFEDVRKAGVLLAAMCKTVEWKKEKKREKDSKAFDQIVTELDASSRKLAEAAAAKDTGAVKTAAGEVGQRCSDCHGRFK
jgi:cytochrome c556